MNLSMLVIAVDLFLFIALVAIKTYYFFGATRRPSLKRWIGFSTEQIMSAQTDEIMHLRKRQNTMSLVLFFLLLITVVIFVMAAKGMI